MSIYILKKLYLFSNIYIIRHDTYKTINLNFYNMFLSYKLMGKDYDSAVMVAGLTGFAMVSTSNAMI